MTYEGEAAVPVGALATLQEIRNFASVRARKIAVTVRRLFGERRRCEWLLTESSDEDLGYVCEHSAQGKLAPKVGSTLTLGEIGEAHQKGESGHARGKIVIRIE